MDLPRALAEEKRPPAIKTMSRQETGWPKRSNKGWVRPIIQAMEASNARRVQQRECQTDLPCPILLFRRQSTGEDRDKEQVVDTEHDLQGGQCQKARPDFQIDYPIHSYAYSWLPAPRSSAVRRPGFRVELSADGLRRRRGRAPHGVP